MVDEKIEGRLRAIVQKHEARGKERLKTAVAKAAVATPVARQKPKARGKNVLLLQEVHTEAVKEVWPQAFPRGVTYTAKERGLAKKLIEAFGYDNVEQVLVHTVECWEDVRMKYRLSGYPSIALIWGYRNSLFPDILDNDGRLQQPASGSRFVAAAATAEEELEALLK
jgi:hypothetical protein